MVTKTQARRKQDIKSKLMAAIAMLLVSSIMMVSSTYAWFTLSTAPEVTGISTAVGANGNLEMALLPTDAFDAISDYGITTGVGDSTKELLEKNVTWGNLVELSNAGNEDPYGLKGITLFPAALNAATEDEDGNPLTLGTAILETPGYGADGRVSELLENTVTGVYNSTERNFLPDDKDYGVRAVGTASGMTPRELDYRNARSAANTAKAAAKTKASQSLNSNGSALANIAIEYGMGADTAEFGKSDVEALRTIIDDLEDKVFPEIEKAYMQYILAYAASSETGESDLAWNAVSGAVKEDGATLESVITALTTGDNAVQLPKALSNAIGAYNGENGMAASVAEADTKLSALEAQLVTDENATFAWSDIREAMEPFANPGSIKINGFPASEVKQNLGALVSSVTAQGGLRVIMGTGAGVYADIADQCGDFSASITIEEVKYEGIVLNNMTAKMETATTINPTYLDAISAAVENKAPSSNSGTVLPITDMYGFIIDLAFRTNAAESNLLLQQDAIDRIYGEENTNEDTMGHGSSMTFQATTTDFSDTQVKELMKAVRIVFFDPSNSNTVVATAKLDAANATLGADGWTAKMYLYELSEGGEDSYELFTGTIDDETTYYYAEDTYETATNAAGAAAAGTKLYTREGSEETGFTYTETTYDSEDTDATYYVKGEPEYKVKDNPSEGDTLYIQKTTTQGENPKTDNVIMPLTQNQAKTLSVLVYLDGEEVTNADVAATAKTSMTGTMNLQFASSANLTPMDYAELNIPAETTDDETQNP